MRKYTIIGGGLAGVTAAMEIKRLDPNGEVTIYAKEPYPYYQRPRLWEYIAGEIDQEQLYFKPVSWYGEKGIDLHLNSPVLEIHPQNQRIVLHDHTSRTYDRLLLATGADSLIPPFAQERLPGLFALRTLEDAQNIISYADRCTDILIIGGGLLGLETGRALLKRGLKVKIAEFMPYLLPRQLDEQGAQVLQQYLSSMGMAIITSASTTKIERLNDRLAVTFKDGRQEKNDMVLLSTGIRSQIELAAASGLQVNRGIVVNPYLQTSQEHIYAAGDSAEFEGIVYGIIPAAVDQGRIAANNMVEDHKLKYTGTVPFTRLKIAGMEFNSLGASNLSETNDSTLTILRKSDLDQNKYSRIVIKDGKIIGAILLGDISNLQSLKQLIESRKDITPYTHQLLDPEFDLKALAKGKI